MSTQDARQFLTLETGAEGDSEVIMFITSWELGLGYPLTAR